MPLLLEFLMNSSPQGMPPQQQDQRNHHQTQLLYFDSLCNYFLFLTDPVFEVSTLSQPSTTMNLVFTASLLCQQSSINFSIIA
ncbi:Uncharacterized protein APZ42_030447 [Daphnia magna]|uniref:Uncharacterized protein n=1 Tax=Daphnia magna TaxID=35525 RepID=A0A162D308_9CRUS|nr:Uncharacterized protein APZ42_030447 [Daphnia magna]